MTNIPRWVAAVLLVALSLTVANAAMLFRQIVVPAAHPVYVAKDLQKDHEFKKAVESIAEDQGYLDESAVTSIIEGCKAVAGGRLKCD
jgi:hypothetical protein